jgi:hypothetical protein
VAEVEVKGIRQLVKALNDVSDDAKNEVKGAMRRIAERVTDKVKAKVPKRTGRAAASYKPRASTRGASIAFGGTKAPYAPWLDFGGKVGRNNSASRPFIRKGRYLYPTIADEGPAIQDELEDALDELARRAGFETKDG